ncbi:MAG: AtpZ/AtpI family protein [Candidatus Aminicenantia bacterium]
MKEKNKKEGYRKLAYLSSLGLMLPSSIAVGMAMGYFLDKWFRTTPWLLLIFTLFGVAAGFYNLIKGISKLKDE